MLTFWLTAEFWNLYSIRIEVIQTTLLKSHQSSMASKDSSCAIQEGKRSVKGEVSLEADLGNPLVGMVRATFWGQSKDLAVPWILGYDPRVRNLDPGQISMQSCSKVLKRMSISKFWQYWFWYWCWNGGRYWYWHQYWYWKKIKDFDIDIEGNIAKFWSYIRHTKQQKLT